MEIAGIYWEWNAAGFLWFLAGAYLWGLVRRYSGPHRVYLREILDWRGHVYQASREIHRQFPGDKAKAAGDVLDEAREKVEKILAGRVLPEAKTDDSKEVDIEGPERKVDWGDPKEGKELRGSKKPPSPEEYNRRMREKGYAQ